MRKVLLFLLIFHGLVFSAFTQDTLISWMNNGAPLNFILIDLRGPSDKIDSVIANSQCTPYNLVWQDEFTQNINKISKEQQIVVYCRSGSRATSAISHLKNQGYLHIYNAGGFNSWTGPKKIYTENVYLPDSILPVPSMTANTSKALITYHKNISPKQHKKVYVNITTPDYFGFRKTFTVSGQSIASPGKVAKGFYCLER